MPQAYAGYSLRWSGTPLSLRATCGLNMIAIYHHLIYGIDDGSPELETFFVMAWAAAAEGVTRIVCTSHTNGQFLYHAALIEERFAALHERLKSEIVLLTSR